ncbi:hypothetical protein BDZ89DRAFT_525121 [Hymenopellis radicata]|nr:hypothetical protein BDZ89DRAFT_525121 [Hymenopellis radicata]
MISANTDRPGTDNHFQFPPCAMSSLEQAFLDDINSFGGSPSYAKHWLALLEARYGEPQRHYHTLAHITSMLECLNSHLSEIVDPQTVRLAIYFHDIVYDPKSSGNELASIELFRQLDHVPSTQLEKVCRYIERTITHSLPLDCGEDDSDLKYFLDFDLEVLSRNRVLYEQYANEIREEYIHYSPEQYCAGRIQVLQKFLLVKIWNGRLNGFQWERLPEQVNNL